MREILRVLKSGGVLIVIAESYERGPRGKLQGWVMRLLKSTNLSAVEHRNLFATAGYAAIELFEERAKGWICVVGKKPE
jgi:ubiquinone/menaquinone biosynthesis C-methylase UbiE